jgi:hypothetical protein
LSPFASHNEYSYDHAMTFLFYQEDTVAWHGNTADLAIVVQAWHDEEGDAIDEDILAKDRYLVEQWRSGVVTEVNGSDLKLVDRSFQVGDICKKVEHDTASLMSGIVVGIDMNLTVEAVATKETIDEPVSSITARPIACLRVGDHVVHGNWLGVVETVFEEAIMAVKGRDRRFKVFSTDEELKYGCPSSSVMSSLHDLHSGNELKRKVERQKANVEAISQTAVLISWLVMNQKVNIV